MQRWLPFEGIMDEGIIKIKNNIYIKIIKIIPINFNLKSNLEKEAILNSYKIFLKTCDFNIQIIVQSNKENLSNNFFKIKSKTKLDSSEIINISKKYIEYLKQLNSKKNSSSKNYFILIKNSPIQIKENNSENIIKNELNEKYYKIKECLSRCGNHVIEIQEKKELIKILSSFYNKN